MAQQLTSTKVAVERGLVQPRPRQRLPVDHSFFGKVPDECLFRILSYLEGDDVGQIAQTNRQFRHLSRGWPFVQLLRTMEISCTSRSWKNLFRKLEHLAVKGAFSRCCSCKLQLNIHHPFRNLKHRGANDVSQSELQNQRKSAYIIPEITHLEILDTSTNQTGGKTSFMDQFSQLFLSSYGQQVEIDKTKVVASRPVLRRFSILCLCLKKVTWVGHRYAMSILGDSLRDLCNLREIYMDSSVFYTDWGSRNHHHQAYQLFQDCKQNLERVDIGHCQVQNFMWSGTPGTSGNLTACYRAEPIPQEALVRFVLSTPTLRWFRSDLSLFNVTMLREERPEVDFVSIIHNLSGN